MKQKLRLLLFIHMFLSAVFFLRGETKNSEMFLTPQDAQRSGILLNKEGSAILAQGGDRGVCFWNLDLKKQQTIKGIHPLVSVKPARGFIPPSDVIVQLRAKEKNGEWSPWFPENILPGGSFSDQNGSGLPDLADVMEITSGVLLRSDLSSKTLPSWVKKHDRTSKPSLVHKKGNKTILEIEKPEAPGQLIVQMHSDRIPPSPVLTLSGFNGWNLGETYTMGLMSRFHEIDTNGNRLNKIMFIGDDDFNQRGGVQPLKWRAVSFVPRKKTRRLNLYPMRLISSPGKMMCAQYQVRMDSLVNPLYRGKLIRKIDFGNMDDWEIPEPGIVKNSPGNLTLFPKPLTNGFVVSSPFTIPNVERVGFCVEMEAQVPEQYNDRDPSHKAWMSTYLEFLDDEDNVADVIQLTACRPRFGEIMASAGEKPPECPKARLRFVASHKTYLSKNQGVNMDGVMVCKWRSAEVFESLYPTDFREPLDEKTLEPGDIPESSCFQIRAFLLSDQKTDSPVLKGINVVF